MDTFVLRLWTPATQAEQAAAVRTTHGTAHHVGSGRSEIFRDGRQLVRLIEELRRSAGAENLTAMAPAARRPAMSVDGGVR
jgi:hypothetical protein